MTDNSVHRRSEIAELERLFGRRQLSRRQFVEALTALGATASGIEFLLGSEAVPAEAQVPPAQYLCLIVLDAFRPDYTTLVPMPNLARLIGSGTAYERAWVGQVESETPTGHASISTGSMPKHDGVIGFEWRDPKTGREVLDGWAPEVLAGKLERDMRQAGVESIPHVIKAADPNARVVALSSEKVYAADAMGAAAADYVLYHRRFGSTLIPAALAHRSPPAAFFEHPHLMERVPLTRFTNWDYLSAMLAEVAIEQIRPRALMINLPGADYYGHPYGGPATPSVLGQVVKGIDRDLGRIMQAYMRAGIYQQTLFVVTADHGMVPNVRAVDGSVVKEVVRQAGGHYLFHTGGTAAYIYLRDPARSRAVAAAMAAVPNVLGSYYLESSPGRYEYLPAPGMKINPSLDAAFRHLLSTFLGPTAPHVAAPFRENTIGTRLSTAHGDHGGLNWGAQAVPLLLSGPGVKSGAVSQYPARLVDVAPTVLRLMGLSPGRMDGLVLADALLQPSVGEIAHQAHKAAMLTGHQQVLIVESIENMDQDLQAGLRPPPSRPARP